ncbi:5886_t:CDS:2 [Diversispora eburnea]|uniref:5886_t:CDS:1 n=1 Tax=Diversispora eburnea TaxID=1213867 RepID=A0A9N9GDN7_9GLOM|nr:5886_t:CDS:2 [Diversispora eburnea]
MPLDRYNRRFTRSVSPQTSAVLPYYRRRSSSVTSGAASPASSTTASSASNTVSFVPSVTTTYNCSYYYDPSCSYAIPDFVNSPYFTPSAYVSPASSVALPIAIISPTNVSPASSTAASYTSSTATSSASSITTILPTYVSPVSSTAASYTSSTAASSTSSDTTTSFSSSLTPSYASVFTNTSSAPTFFATNYSNSANSTTTTISPASFTALLTAASSASSNTTTSSSLIPSHASVSINTSSASSNTTSSSSLIPSYASVSVNTSSAPTFFATNYSSSVNSSSSTTTTTNSTVPSIFFATDHLNTSFTQASPMSSRESSVAPGNRHDAKKSVLTSPDIELDPPVVVNRARLSVIRNQRKINNRYTPYIGSSLNERGTRNHLEMAEDVCKHYIPKPAMSLHLWNRPPRADRVALRKNNTGIKFRDGFIKHARSPASHKPCYNNLFEQYQIERLGRDDQRYEKAISKVGNHFVFVRLVPVNLLVGVDGKVSMVSIYDFIRLEDDKRDLIPICEYNVFALTNQIVTILVGDIMRSIV